MSEEIEGPIPRRETGGSAESTASTLAMAGASREEADKFLQHQRRLSDEQNYYLREQFKTVRPTVWGEWLLVFLRLATAAVGVAVAAGFSLLVWDAAHSSGLIIEPFNVPPDMASRGLSGQVVAARLQDKLTALQDATDSSRAPQSYANNWGDNIKVEIPDTGISIGELQHFLKDWLGHDTHITGEVYHTAAGIVVSARAGASTGATFTGAETELDALLQKAAEHVYADTQPYRYANFLDRDPSPSGRPERRARAEAIYQQLSQSPDTRERAWAINGLGTLASSSPAKGNRVAADYYRKAIAVWPDFTIGHYALGYREFFLDRRESELTEFRTAARLLHLKSIADVHPKALPLNTGEADGLSAGLTGDFAQAVRSFKAVADTHITFANGSYRLAQMDAILSLENQHDRGGARAYMRDIGMAVLPSDSRSQLIAAMRQDWLAVEARPASMSEERRARISRDGPVEIPPLALARAHLGDIGGAEAVLATSPSDCDGCLLAHAQIAEMRGQQARADYWFARAEAHAPRIPFACHEWGLALLGRGKPDAAIQKFKIANQKGPHFADPLEGWGEALMAKNQSHRALAKFEEANKYAPNWGRLHLKWGEALIYAGKPAEAKAQFARAAALDLSPSEKSERDRAASHV